MNRQDTIYAARPLAGTFGVEDDQDVDILATDELFAAYAYLHEKSDLYAGELEQTMVAVAMVGAAHCAAEDCYTVAKTRAEELLGEELEDLT